MFPHCHDPAGKANVSPPVTHRLCAAARPVKRRRRLTGKHKGVFHYVRRRTYTPCAHVHHVNLNLAQSQWRNARSPFGKPVGQWGRQPNDERPVE